MTKKFKLIILTCILFTGKINAQALQTFHDFWGVTILGDTISFSQWSGKKLLIVNTASFCGFTPQFTDLQALDSIYQSNNFEVIGFPCNDFGNQDPGDDSTINNFCTGIYGVQFQMMSKVGIKLPDTAECYKWLQWQYLNGVADAPVTWNFHKFCIDEAGGWVAHHPSQTTPFDTAIVNWILSPPVPTGIKNADADFNLQLQNNPSMENFEIIVNANITVDLVADILGIDGKVIDTRRSVAAKGKNYIRFNKHLNAGLYFIRIKNQNSGKTIKAVKL